MSDPENDKNKDQTTDFDQKLAKVNQQLETMNQQFADQLKQMTEVISTRIQPTPQRRQEEVEVDPYSPDYAKILAKKAAEEAVQAVERTNSMFQQKQAVINNLAIEYPELASQTSDLTKQVVAAHSKLSNNLQNTPEGYKLAVREAAAELGILPKSKRQSSDDFTLSGNNQPTKRKEQESELSEETLMAAELMGLNIKDKNVLERLKGHSTRNFGRYK